MFLTIVFFIFTSFLLAIARKVNLLRAYCDSIDELKKISSPCVNVPVIVNVVEFETVI